LSFIGIPPIPQKSPRSRFFDSASFRSEGWGTEDYSKNKRCSKCGSAVPPRAAGGEVRFPASGALSRAGTATGLHSLQRCPFLCPPQMKTEEQNRVELKGGRCSNALVNTEPREVTSIWGRSKPYRNSPSSQSGAADPIPANDGVALACPR
jgi:hypothetical protein